MPHRRGSSPEKCHLLQRTCLGSAARPLQNYVIDINKLVMNTTKNVIHTNKNNMNTKKMI